MIRDYFNQRADTWERQASEKDAGKLAAMAARMQLRPGMTVLDVGTGTGVFLPYLLGGVGPEGTVLALDIAEKMLLSAQAKRPGPNVHYLCADITCIPLVPGACDVVVCYSSFPHFPDKPRALVEMRKLLKPGGRLFICHTAGREKINRIHTGVPVLSHDLLPDGAEMWELLRGAGFTEISVEDSAGLYFAVGRQ